MLPAFLTAAQLMCVCVCVFQNQENKLNSLGLSFNSSSYCSPSFFSDYALWDFEIISKFCSFLAVSGT